MKTTGRVVALVTICAASIAFAKDGVTNEAVIARTDAMQLIRQSTKTLGSMVQGKRAFDSVQATQAATLMAVTAADIPALFEAQETDPKSEAKPEIWSNWDDFVDKATALKTGAEALDSSSLATLKASFGGAAKTCRACHSKYTH